MKTQQSDISGYIAVVPDDGNMLTFFVDGDSPDTYVGAHIIHISDEFAIDSIREITYEQHLAYKYAAEHYDEQSTEHSGIVE